MVMLNQERLAYALGFLCLMQLFLVKHYHKMLNKLNNY